MYLIRDVYGKALSGFGRFKDVIQVNDAEADKFFSAHKAENAAKESAPNNWREIYFIENID